LDAGRAEQPIARLIGAAALSSGAGLHLVFVPGYALPVLDRLFTASATGMVLGAVLLIALAPRLGWLIGGATAFLTFLGYVLSPHHRPARHLDRNRRLVFPLGIPSLIVEGIAFSQAIWALTDRHGLNSDRLTAERRALTRRR
jgi:hypothetical protein